jgi:hypothetical protein
MSAIKHLRFVAERSSDLHGAPVHYRIYFMAGDGHIQHALDIDCQSDEAAIQVVEDHEDGRAKELWCGQRRVATFPRLAEQPAR